MVSCDVRSLWLIFAASGQVLTDWPRSTEFAAAAQGWGQLRLNSEQPALGGWVPLDDLSTSPGVGPGPAGNAKLGGGSKRLSLLSTAKVPFAVT
jgi:hypothetical protein